MCFIFEGYIVIYCMLLTEPGGGGGVPRGGGGGVPRGGGGGVPRGGEGNGAGVVASFVS